MMNLDLISYVWWWYWVWDRVQVFGIEFRYCVCLESGSGVRNRVQVLCVFGIGFRCSKSGSSVIGESVDRV